MFQVPPGSMGKRARRMVFLLILTLIAAPGALPERPRTLAFQDVSKMSIGVDVGHLVSKIDVYAAVNNYNNLLRGLDANYARGLQKGQSVRYILLQSNQTMQLLHSEARGIGATLRFLCDMLKMNCTIYESPYTFQVTGTEKLTQEKVEELEQEKLRVRRSAVSGIFGAFDLGLSVYTFAETKMLAREVSDVVSNQKHIAITVNQNRDAILQEQKNQDLIHKHVNMIHNVTNGVIAQQWLTELVTLTRLELQEIDAFANGVIDMLINRKLSPRFYEPQHLQQSYVDLKNKAQDHDLAPVLTSISALMEAPLSYVMVDDHLVVMAHVYLARRERFTLYRYLNLPIHLDDGYLATVDTNGKEFFAINSAHTEYLVLSSQEVESCKKEARILLCDFGLTHRVSSKHCLLSLFYGDPDEVQKGCVFRETQQSALTTALGPSTVHVMARDQQHTSVSLNCKDQKRRIEIVTSEKIFNVSDDCVLTTTNSIFRPSRRFDLEAGYTTTPLPKFNFSMRELRTLAPPMPNLTHVGLHRLVLDPVHEPSHLALILAAIAIVLLIVAGIVIYFLLRKHSGKHTKFEESLEEMKKSLELSSLKKDMEALKPKASPPPRPLPAASSTPSLLYTPADAQMAWRALYHRRPRPQHLSLDDADVTDDGSVELMLSRPPLTFSGRNSPVVTETDH